MTSRSAHLRIWGEAVAIICSSLVPERFPCWNELSTSGKAHIRANPGPWGKIVDLIITDTQNPHTTKRLRIVHKAQTISNQMEIYIVISIRIGTNIHSSTLPGWMGKVSIIIALHFYSSRQSWRKTLLNIILSSVLSKRPSFHVQNLVLYSLLSSSIE